MLVRSLFAAVLAVLLVTPALARQDQDAEKRLRDRVMKAVDEDLKKMRQSVLDAAKQAMAKAPAEQAPPKLDGTLESALGLVTEDLLKGHVTFLASDELEGRNAGFPGNDKAAEYIADIMKKCGLKPVGDADKDGKATYFQHFKVFGRQTQNCLGVIEGTDPDLKKEIVVLGAHFDHVGTKDQGHWGQMGGAKNGDTIWNGADDNGSGTSTVLGLIKAFTAGGVKSKRTLLFMLFSGEEGGLLGSAYYVRHPMSPIGQHVFMLNLDMVGRNPDKPMEIHGVGSAEKGVIQKAVEAAVAKSGLEAKLHEKVDLMGGDSDHSSFRDADVPFTFFFSGFHADYHRVSDTAEKLAYPNMVKVAKASAFIITAIADADKRPIFAGKGAGNDFNFSDPTTPPANRRMLGVTPIELNDEDFDAAGLGKDEGGVKVDRVSAGSVAETAGVKVGDIVLSIGAKKLGRGDPTADLRAALQGVEAGKETDLQVLRGRERVKLKATWEK